MLCHKVYFFSPRWKPEICAELRAKLYVNRAVLFCFFFANKYLMRARIICLLIVLSYTFVSNKPTPRWVTKVKVT